MGLVQPDFGLIFWMTLSFGIVFFILKKFAWKPIIKSLTDREIHIDSALKAADQAKKDMEELSANNERIMMEAKVERDKLIKEAREVKETIIKDAKGLAQIEAKKLIEAARESIQTEKATAITEIKNQVSLLSVEIAEKILKRELENEAGQKLYIKELLKEINSN